MDDNLFRVVWKESNDACFYAADFAALDAAKRFARGLFGNGKGINEVQLFHDNQRVETLYLTIFNTLVVA